MRNTTERSVASVIFLLVSRFHTFILYNELPSSLSTYPLMCTVAFHFHIIGVDENVCPCCRRMVRQRDVENIFVLLRCIVQRRGCSFVVPVSHSQSAARQQVKLPEPRVRSNRLSGQSTGASVRLRSCRRRLPRGSVEVMASPEMALPSPRPVAQKRSMVTSPLQLMSAYLRAAFL